MGALARVLATERAAWVAGDAALGTAACAPCPSRGAVGELRLPRPSAGCASTGCAGSGCAPVCLMSLHLQAAC